MNDFVTQPRQPKRKRKIVLPKRFRQSDGNVEVKRGHWSSFVTSQHEQHNDSGPDPITSSSSGKTSSIQNMGQLKKERENKLIEISYLFMSRKGPESC